MFDSQEGLGFLYSIELCKFFESEIANNANRLRSWVKFGLSSEPEEEAKKYGDKEYEGEGDIKVEHGLVN